MGEHADDAIDRIIDEMFDYDPEAIESSFKRRSKNTERRVKPKYVNISPPKWKPANTAQAGIPDGFMLCPSCQDAGEPWDEECQVCEDRGIVEIEVQQQKEEPMTSNNNLEMIRVLQIRNNAQIVKVSFNQPRATKNRDVTSLETGRLYSFINVTGKKLSPGDLVVTETKEDRVPTLATVVTVNVPVSEIGCQFHELKHVIDKVDLEALTATREREGEATARMAMADTIRRQKEMQEALGIDDLSTIESALLAPPSDDDVIDG